jgi:rhodanese-related sulfurtransferase
MKQISVNELKSNYNIIDIRSRDAYLNGHIYNAQNISMNLLLNMPERYLSKDNIYYIYCSSGYNSKKCCKLLEMIGYNVVNIIGGYDEFKNKF